MKSKKIIHWNSNSLSKMEIIYQIKFNEDISDTDLYAYIMCLLLRLNVTEYVLLK